jgi:hypothetical protein
MMRHDTSKTHENPFTARLPAFTTGLSALANWFVSRHDGLSLPPGGRINNLFGNKIQCRMVLLIDGMDEK